MTEVLTMAAGMALIAGAALAADPMDKPDDAWISVEGTVGTVAPDAFVLDYGKGTITVEMDDGDRDADAYKLMTGDKVTVHGLIDDDLFETRTIEASSVYVEKLGTSFYASATDEEDSFVTIWAPVVPSRTVLQGTVTDVRSEEFTLNTGARIVTVEVEEMPYDPLDNEGYQKVDVGDRVSVSGVMDDDLFEGRELVADSLVILNRRGD